MKNLNDSLEDQSEVNDDVEFFQKLYADDVKFHGTAFPDANTARWAVFFERLGLEWRYMRIAGRGTGAVKGFELPGLATPCKRFIVAADEPEAWAIRLAAIYKAAILVGEPYLEEIDGWAFKYWYKIVMGQHEQYVFAYCRRCDTTIEFFPAFAEASARFVDSKHKVHRYECSRGEGWGYCRCCPDNDKHPLPYDPRFLFAAQVAQSHINLPGVGLTIFTDGNM